MAHPGPTDETTLAPAGDAETRLSSGTGSGTPVAAKTGMSSGAPPSSSHSGWLSTSQTDAGRFASGTILADRYRIIGLAGKGGMGEVYRADDLRLGQPVALKFLPESVSKDPTRLAQFHNEVRTARQISHRNVCRVYDIGEADDRIFLTMEYVDGEDLSTLLRRVGRFPSDRAIEISRQICAGLAAAHEFNVLHRDLKPANIMLDGDGRVRITDFGLAGLAGEIKDIRAGTPAYMAPEQLAGREVSIRSDLFSLGLVLYEIFTGKRAFDAKNVAELLRMHDAGLALTPTAAVRDMDPAVERLILRCLDRDPQRRPLSALAVAAALPGGDPLAAALAAGETPSPEMVANAGNRDAIHPALGLTAVGCVLVLVAVAVVMVDWALIFHRVPFDKPPEVLLDRARTLEQSLGYPATPFDSASGFDVYGDYVNYVRKSAHGASRWQELSSGRDPLTIFWYRTSPRTMVREDVRRRVDISTPARSVPGMTTLVLDPKGRLTAFEAFPIQTDGQANAPPPNWDLLFEAAQVPKDRFTPATSEWTPIAFADTRVAWTGTLPEYGDKVPIRLEAASYHGRITSFHIIYPWSEPRRGGSPARSWTEAITGSMFYIIEFALIAVSAVIARHNLRAGRSNQTGALRVAIFAFVVETIGYLIDANHVPFLEGETRQWYSVGAFALWDAAMMWVFYVALEPAVRRFWPDGLISWNRLLAGRWRDPLVGWHLLCGVGWGVALMLTLRGGFFLKDYLEDGAAVPYLNPLFLGANARLYVGYLFQWLFDAVNISLLIVLLYAVARGSRAAAGRNLFALVIMGVLLIGLLAREFLTGNNLPFELSFCVLIVVVIAIAMLRFGLWAMMVMFFVNNVMNSAPFTLNPGDWFAPMSFAIGVLVVGLAVAGFVISRGGEPLLGRVLAEEN
jgi:serine/threonine-protein kinase